MSGRPDTARERGWMSGALPIGAWGLALVAVAVFGTIVFGLSSLPTLLLAGAGALCLLYGVTTAWTGRRAAREAAERRPEVDLDLSLPTVVACWGLMLVLVGASSLGPGVFWPGLAILVAGLGALVRETLAARLLGRRLAARTGAPRTGPDARREDA